jgi:hypothetical protein
MDLGTVRKKLQEGAYENVDQVVADVQLIWNNAKVYAICRPRSL